MKHKLVATFANEQGKQHKWTYKDIDTDLPAETIKEACELLTNLDIFEQDGVKLFDTVVTAKIVTTIEHEIFDRATDFSIDFPMETNKETVEEIQTTPLLKETKELYSGSPLTDSSIHSYPVTLPTPAVEPKTSLTTHVLPKQSTEKQLPAPVQAKEPPVARRRHFPFLFHRRQRQKE